jgi:PIN domain nuclease of toxin-antitoxin system
LAAALLDTQAFYLAATGGTLPRKVLALLKNDDAQLYISAISIMEIELKTRIGKMKQEMGEKEIRQYVRDLRLSVLPFEAQYAFKLYEMPLHHRDPFDRMIIATALTASLPLVGADREFKKYKGLKTIW